MHLSSGFDIYHLNLSPVAIENSTADLHQKQQFWFSYSTHCLFSEEPNQRYFKQILPVEEQRIKIDWYAIIRWGIKHVMVDLQRKAGFRKAIAAFSKKKKNPWDCQWCNIYKIWYFFLENNVPLYVSLSPHRRREGTFLYVYMEVTVENMCFACCEERGCTYSRREGESLDLQTRGRGV